MRKSNRRIISMLLAALMCAGTVITPVAATESHHHHDDEDKIPTVSSQIFAKGLKPFTSTEDLIRDTVEEIREKGQLIQASDKADALAEMMERKGDFTLPEITTDIGRAFLAQNDTKRFDTSKYHLDADEMKEVLERVFSKYSLSNVVDYKLKTDKNGEVASIEYELRDSFQIAMDEINSVGAEEESELVQAEISAEAEAAALTSYYEEYPEEEAAVFSVVSRSAVLLAEEGGEGSADDGGEQPDPDVPEEPEEPEEPVTPVCAKPAITWNYVWSSDKNGNDVKCQLVFKSACNCDGCAVCADAETCGHVQTQTIKCEITGTSFGTGDQAELPVTYTAKPDASVALTGNFEGYTDYDATSTTEIVHKHTYGEPTFAWKRANDTVDPTCDAIFTCIESCPLAPDYSVTKKCGDDDVTFVEVVVEDGKNIEVWTAAVEAPLTGTVYTSEERYGHVHQYKDTYSSAKWIFDSSAEDYDDRYICQVGFECPLCPETVSKHISWELCEVKRIGPDAEGTVTYVAKYDNTEISGDGIESRKYEYHTCEYGTPVFTWSEDGITSCTAVVTCLENDDRICNDDVAARYIRYSSVEDSAEYQADNVITIKGIKDPETSAITYVATLEFDGETYSSIGTTVGHVHGFADNRPVFAWASDYSYCTATAVCVECGDEVSETLTNVARHEDADANTRTYTVTTNIIRDSAGKPWQDSAVEELVHRHTFEGDFNWVNYYDVNDIGEDGNPQAALFYDPAYQANPDDPTLVYYDPATGIGVSVMRKIMYTCTSGSVTCTECGATYNSGMDGVQLTSEAGMPVGAENPEAFFQTTPQELWPEFGSDTMVATITLVEDGYAYTTSEVLNVTSERLKIHYAEMVKFNDAFPQYFGVAVPFWTSKNTEATPLDAIKTLINQAGNYVPNTDMDTAVEGLTWAFISYVMQYGQVLDAMLAEAMATITNDMTDIQKMLVLHDWLAKNASFDMQSLIDMKSGESSGGDPITMTAFGTLLSGQFASLSGTPSYGAVCLGYAATYALLVQQAFPKYYSKTPDHIIDFVQIKFHANVAESSVAGADSGFGDGDAIFNEPHYFNAIRLDAETHGLTNSEETPLDENGYCWYYTDACYDDINVEVISQYRVESDGNISHMYFMNSPQSFLDMFEDNFDYFDSLYDGQEFFRKPLNYADMPMVDDNNNPIDYSGYGLPAEALYPQLNPETMNPVYETDDQGYDIWYAKASDSEIAYADDQFEQTWFSNATSEIIYYQKNWYYIEGAGNSYSAMKDMFGDDEETEGGNNNNNNMDMTDEDMLQYKYDPDNADTLMVRPGGKGDRPANANENSGNQNNMSSTQYEDMYAEVLFHFGYGAAGDVAEDTEVTEANKADFPWYDLVKLDDEYNQKYPDLNHSLAMMYNSNSQKNADGDGKLYFNLANRIMVYDVDDDSLTQLKEYNVVNSITDGRPFTGMSFYTPETAEREGISGTEAYTVVDKPIASVMINDMVYWEDNYAQDPATGEYTLGQDGQMDTRNVVPALYVSLATNYSNSYAPNDDPYTIEAVNFNPDYYRFMDDDDEEEEEETDEEENTNVEFMWCANIVDIMKMDAMLAENKAGTTVPYSMGATCSNAAFTEDRTPEFGLSDGSSKVISEEETDLECHYFYHDYSSPSNSINGSSIGWVCFRCNDYQTDVESSLKHNKETVGENAFEPVWSEDNTTLESCMHFHGECPVYDCPKNSRNACDITELKEDATAPELVTGYQVTCTVCGESQQYAVVHDHIEGENLTYVEAVAATCTAIGNVEYWICQNELCGKYLVKATDEETGETVFVETTAEDVVTEMIPHAIPEEPTDAGRAETCNADGKKPYWTCETCAGTFVKETNEETGEEVFTQIAAEELEAALVIPMDPAKHAEELVYHEAGEPNCVSGGSIAFYSCAACQKNFSDAEGTVEIESSDVDKDPDNHAGEIEYHAAVPATCEATGTIEYWSCTACGVNYSDEALTTVVTEIETEIDPANHTAVEHHAAVPATCEATGTIEYWHCTGCDVSYSDEALTVVVTEIETEIDPANHTAELVYHEAGEPNCVSGGSVAFYSCAACQKNFSDAEGKNEIESSDVDKDPNNHAEELVYVEAVAATCTENGIAAHWNCPACGKNFSDEAGANALEAIETPVDENNHVNTVVRDAVKPGEGKDGYTGDTYCIDCGKKIAEGEEYNYIPGDVNNDGSVDNKDLTRLFQYLSGWDVEVNEAAVDINGDGSSDNKDLTRLFQYLSNWDVEIY